jgi:hypothetical protein
VPDRVPAPLGAPADDEADHVGVVTAKSAEGDAGATILARKPGIQVIKQPLFWEIRSKVRLAIPDLEISDHLGYELVRIRSSARCRLTSDGCRHRRSAAPVRGPTEAMGYLVA